MVWVRLDDKVFQNRKVRRLSKDAKLIYLAGLTFCADRLTDGYIEEPDVRLIAALADCRQGAAKELHGTLWDRVGDRWRVHDWDEYNPSSAKVLAERAAAKERMRRVRSGEQPREQEGALPFEPPRERPPEVPPTPVTRTRKPVTQPSSKDKANQLLTDDNFMQELRSRFTGIELDYECLKWVDHVTTKPPKGNYKNSLRNWLGRVQPQAVNGNGVDPQVEWLERRYREGKARLEAV